MMALAVVSTAQLAFGLIGLRQALREGTTYAVWKLKWDPGRIKRDQWVLGTGLSASGVMLILQGVATAGLLSRRRRRAAAKTLGVLGAVMCGGYPVEKSIRQAWQGNSPGRSIMPLTAAATGRAAVMAELGRCGVGLG
jgi:hypothetical protein